MMRVSNEKGGGIKLEEIQADLAAFKAKHADEADPKRSHVFLYLFLYPHRADTR